MTRNPLIHIKRAFSAKVFPLLLTAVAYLTTVRCVYAQELYFSNLSEKVQIPASETYNVIQDKQGYIWFATEEGFCRYSNNSLTVFGENEGLPEKAVYVSAIGPDGKLWIATRNQRILYFDGKKFVEAFFSKEYARKMQNEWGYAVKLIFQDTKLIVQSESNTAEIDLKSGAVRFLPKLDYISSINECGNDVFFNPKKKSGPSYCSLFRLNSPPVSLDLKGRKLFIPSIPIRFGKQILMTSGNWIWNIDERDNMRFYEFDDRILTMKSDPEGNLLFGLQNKGLYLFRNGDLNSTPVISLRGVSVSGILFDKNGGLWCTTLEKGVFYCQSTKVLSYQHISELSGRISVLQSVPGLGIVALKNGGPKLLQLSETAVKQFAELPPSSSYHTIDRIREGFWISTGSEGIVLNDITRKSKVTRLKNAMSLSYGVIEKGNEKVLFRYISLVKVRGESWTEFYRYKSGRLKSFLQIDRNRYLLFGKGLLLIYDKRNDHVEELKKPAEEITCAAPADDNCVLLGTRDKGLFCYNTASQTFYSVKAGIPTEIIYSVLRDRYGYFWIGTNEGVFRCDPGLKTSTWISKKFGLPLTETRQIAETGNYIYFGTNDGVFSLNTSALTASSGMLRPIVSIKTKTAAALLSVDVNFFEKDASFYYRIEGPEQIGLTKSTSWNERLNNLAPGDYTLYGFVQSADGSRSPIARKSFYIAPTLVQTLWFRSLMIILCLLLVWLVIRWRVKIVRRREEEKNRVNMQLAEFQMSALQAQMNPHFIFNAINTIQSYILTRNKDEAYKYLNKFSNLIRLVLHHSQDQLITLSEELQVITTYIELEQARFANFDYKVNVHPEVDIHEVMIPAMVIQPYLENAIWHGLNHLSDRTGLLSLDFSIDGDELKIVMKDNGIGRAAAAAYRTSRHRSVGLSITQKRLEMLKNIYEEGNAFVEVIDEISDGQPSGTTVIIRLPLL